jgi:catechol 2,3-dioxygenase-like lactoylglutathione lyase family enzyme
MMNGSKLVAFAATARPDEARTFYSQILGFPILDDTQFALVLDANGTTLRVQKVEKVSPPPYTALGWAVDNIASAITQIRKHGVAFENFEGLEQDSLGIWTAPGGTSVAWFRDPDGNLLSLTQDG